MKKKKHIYFDLFGFHFEGNGIDKNIVFDFNDNTILKAEDVLNNVFATADFEDGTFYNKDGDVIGTIEDLTQFSSFEEGNVCIFCNGDGYIESDQICDKPASMCCGGCTQTFACECELFYN